MVAPAPPPVPAAAAGPLHALAPPPPARWVPNRKVVAQVTANVLTWGVALAVSHYGLHENSLEAGIITAAIGIVAGAVAGYLVREIPRIEAEVKPAATKM